MKNLDVMYKQKQFFKAFYGNLGEGEYIRVYQNNKTNYEKLEEDFSRVEHFNDIDELVKYCTINRYDKNTYYELATTNGIDGTSENLLCRYTLDFDFDKKDEEIGFDHKDITNRFRELGLWYHSLIASSNNGYHAHISIEPCGDLDKVTIVQKKLQELLKSDPNANKSTQLLRVPYTFNIKDEKAKLVTTLVLFEKSTIKPYNIDSLYKRFCSNECDNVDSKRVKSVLKTTNIPYCIENILNNGSEEGNRNLDLQKIVVTFRKRNRSLSDTLAIVTDWNNKNKVKLSSNELKYQTEYMYENLLTVSYDCQECTKGTDCFKHVISDFEYDDKEILLTMNEKTMKHLKNARKGSKSMNGNQMLIYSVLKLHRDGLLREEIVKELTYKDECRLSKNTLTEALKSLVDNKFVIVEKKGKENFYRINEVSIEIDETFTIGYGATLCCIKNNITTEELRLYNYMRYLHSKMKRDGTSELQGNLFQINQDLLAEKLQKSQQQISFMINNLIDEKIISIWYRGKSKNNTYTYNIYRLNL